jgi:hypothetical protein
MQSGLAGRVSAVSTARAGYALLAFAAGACALFTGTLGRPAYPVLFAGISLYFLKQGARRRRSPEPGAAVAADAMQDRERGGFPLVVIAVAGMLLGVSAASFAMTALASNPPDNGVCDYDRAPAVAVDGTTAANGSAVPRREFCDAHTGYFMLANPFDPVDLGATTPAAVTFLGRPASSWVPVFSALWAVFALLMVAASVNPATPAAGREPVLVICGLVRGALALVTALAATLLFVLVAADPAARLDAVTLPPGSPAALPGSTGPVLYAVMMVVVVAFLAAFFRRRGGG